MSYLDDRQPLKLIAKDLEDLLILSAHLQDALMPLTTMIHDKKLRTFTLLANRFCWEHEAIAHEGQDLFHRVHSGLCFMNVEGIHHKGFDLKQDNRMLSFLSFHFEESKEESIPSTLHLIFSSNNEIRLKVQEVACHLGDLSHPWPTYKRPMHLHDHVKEHLVSHTT